MYRHKFNLSDKIPIPVVDQSRNLKMPGYGLKFVDKVRKRHQCPLCHLPVRDPVQITTCKHRFCDACLQDFLGRGIFNCPVDHLSLDFAKIYPDPDLEGEVMNLTTHCSNYSVGCKWTGKLHSLKTHLTKCSHSEVDCPNRCGIRMKASKLADHLEYECLKRRVKCEFCSKDFSGEQLEDHEGNCPMESVHCENKCGAKMLRKYLSRHMNGDCPKRAAKCPHCDNDFNCDILKTHFGNCPRYPIGCPNRCDVLKIPREDLEIHMKEQCKAALTNCPFKEAGCKHKCPRYHLDRHLTENQQIHMRSMFELTRSQKKQIEQLQKQISDLTVSQNGVLLWRIPEYSKSLQTAQKEHAEAELISPPFYTHKYGYKLQLSAFLNGNGSGHGTHLSLYIRVLNGDYDGLLEWPFSHDITFSILDQGDPLSSKRSHINVTFTPDPNWKNFQAPEIRKDDSDADGSNLGFGYPKFVSHKELKDNNYLKNNTLFIKASVDTSRIVIQ